MSLNEETTDTCLPKATLEKLGFTGEGTNVKVDSPAFCTDVYADPGRCIAADNIKTVIENYQTEFSTSNAGYAQIATVFDTFFGNIGESISGLWTKVTGSDDEKKEKSWKSQMAEEVSKAKEVHDTCFKTHNQLTHGVSCLLSSGKAAQKSSESGETLTVSISKSATQLVTDCMPVISAVCFFYKGGAEAKLEIPQTQTQKDLCELHKVYVKCLADGKADAECLDDTIKQNFFEKMYAPYKSVWLPSVEEVTTTTTKLLAWFESVKDKVFSWFKNTDETTPESSGSSTTRRILASTIEVKFTFVEDGADLYVMGGKSQVKVIGIKIHHFGILTIMIAFILRLN